MPRRRVIRGDGTTRQGILAAAAKRFASASYDDVGLRDLAADVGVDVAYVHRSFGSKEHLFREVLESGEMDAGLSIVEPQALASHLARKLFERAHAKRPDEPDPLSILIRSLTSPVAGRLVGARVQGQFIEPIQQKINDTTPLRATMIMSLLIGFGILQNLLRLSVVAEVDPAQAESLIASAIDEITKLGAGHDSGKA